MSRLDDFLERPIADVAAPLLRAELPDHDAVAARVGAYRVVRELGRGGMGVVCLAERNAGHGSPVALKVMRRNVGADGTLEARFTQERQVLALLHHPGIARLLDEGVTQDGRPWFAMEYVNGVPIDAYANIRGLDRRARVDLFARVCDAVQHAHERGIVHRDVKPSNILVTVDGAVKLLDFGIAKPIGASALTALRTRTGHGRLTRDYASPEQLRGQPVTPASDVYALGVVLYELLTGRHPAHRRGLLFRVLGPRLGSEFPRALDSVVRRALRSDPRRRYANARELGVALASACPVRGAFRA